MNRIKELRESKGITMKDAAAQLNLPYTTYVNYEKGTREPNSEMLISLANFYESSVDYLIGRSDSRTDSIPPGFQPMPKTKAVPLIGRIACGEPITAEENIESIVHVPDEWNADFSLRCIGDSMEPKIKNGDIVAVRKVPEVANGKIAAVRLDNEATLKKMYVYPDRLELRPINPDYEPIVLYREDMNKATIEGIAVGLCRGL